jgi:hypothetical protein
MELARIAQRMSLPRRMGSNAKNITVLKIERSFKKMESVVYVKTSHIEMSRTKRNASPILVNLLIT